MTGVVYADLGLPNITVAVARGANAIGGFGLVGRAFTIAYQSPNLGAGLPCCTFTNHYHRGLGTHTDPDL